MSDFLNEVTEKVNKAIMDELSTKGYCYASDAENILRRELGLPSITLDTDVGWTADSGTINLDFEQLVKEKKNKVKENKMANINDASYIIPSISERTHIEPVAGAMFRSTADAISTAIATVQSNTIKTTTDAPPKLYEPSYTFSCQTAAVNMEDFYKLFGVPVVKEDTKKEKENKMKKDELKPVYNTDPKFVKYDEYAGYSILGIKVLAANKVVVVTIGEKALPTIAVSNGVKNVRTYKQICREPDVFEFKYAVALALTKHLHRDPGKRLTTYGLERMTEYYLTYSYDFNKEVDRALKAYTKCEREEAMKKAKEEEIKRIKERRAAKQKRNRERRRERRMNGQS